MPADQVSSQALAARRLRCKRLRRQRRFERPLRDLSGYLLYAAAPLMTWLLDRKLSPDDPLRTTVEDRRRVARRRPFYGDEAVEAYVERMMVWFYLVFATLGGLLLAFPVSDATGSRVLEAVALHPIWFGFWLALIMLLICGAKTTLAWVCGMVQFGRDREEPFEDHSIYFEAIEKDPSLRRVLDPPVPISGRLVRWLLTPSNVETAVAMAVALVMTLGLIAFRS